MRGLNTRLGKCTAAGVTATAAIGSRQHFLHLVDSRVFLNFELLGHKEKNDRKQRTEDGDDCNSPDNCCCHIVNNILELFFLYVKHEILGESVSKDIYTNIIEQNTANRAKSGINFVSGNGRQR